MIEADIKEVQFSPDEYPIKAIPPAEKCLENWKEWKRTHSFKPIESELSLISEETQTGGTIDIVAMIDGKLSIADIKTGKEVYENHIIQLEFYKHLWEENFPEYPLEGGFHIIRTGKEIAMFSHAWYGEFPYAWSVFLKLRELYEEAKHIKRLK
jgi:hypothetical protein